MRANFCTFWIITTAFAVISSGQTQLDLRTQSKSVDFSAAQSTKPFQTGTTLPATCSVGQMYFVTTAPGGQNSFGCTATNTWTLESGSAPSPTVVRSAGVTVGTRSTLDLSTGVGVLWSVSDTGQEISVQAMLDTSVAQTRSSHQSGSSLFCSSTGNTAPITTYSCAMSPTLTAYSTGMVLAWRPDVNGTGGPTTLNIDSLGTRRIAKADGSTDPAAGEILGGQLYQLWYDGSFFRLVAGVTSGSGSSGSPASAGATGPAGPTGLTGPTGPTGPAGASGSSTAIAAGGYYFPFGFPVENGSTGYFLANTVKVHLFVPSGNMQVAALSYYVTSAPGCTSGSPCRLAAGIYNSSGTLVSQQSAPVAGVGVAQVTFSSPPAPTAGLHWPQAGFTTPVTIP